MRRSDNTFTTIVVCTDDEDSVSYLNKWDKKISKLDVIDDYRKLSKQKYLFVYIIYVINIKAKIFYLLGNERLEIKRAKVN